MFLERIPLRKNAVRSCPNAGFLVSLFYPSIENRPKSSEYLYSNPVIFVNRRISNQKNIFKFDSAPTLKVMYMSKNTEMMISHFTWMPIYQELANELAGWENRQEELISFLEELRSQGFVITPLYDKDGDGARFLLKEIDPFTFLGVFNRRIGYDQRRSEERRVGK